MVEDKYAVTFIHPSHFKGIRNVWISEFADEDGVWKTEEGSQLQAQKYTNGWLVEVDSITSFGVEQLYFEPTAKKKQLSVFEFDNETLKTPYYTVKFNETDQMVRLFDKEANHDVLLEGANGNQLQIFEDKPLAFDVWDIDIFYQEKMDEIRELTNFEVVENGELSFVIHAEWTYNQSTFNQKMTFYANDRRIDFKTNVNWHEKQKLLKVAFPVDIRATVATYDIQYGNVQRPTHWNTSWDMARFESVGHKWADLS